MRGTKFIVLVLVISALAVLALPFITRLVIYPAFSRYQVKSADEYALVISKHLTKMLSDHHDLNNYDSPSFAEEIENAKERFNFFKIKVFTPDGKVVYSTIKDEIGDINTHPYFFDIVLKGNIYSKEAKKDTRSLDGHIIPIDVFETYIPIMEDGKPIIIFETYFDLSAGKAAFGEIASKVSNIIYISSLLLFFVIIIISIKAKKSIDERNHAEEELRDHSDNLKKEIDEHTVGLRNAVIKLADEKAWTDSVFAGIGDGISIQGLDYKIIYQNQVHKDLIGHDCKGETCYKVYAKTDDVCDGCPVEASFKDGESHTLIKPFPKTGGYIEIKASTLRDSSGKIVAGIEMVRDITKRMRLQNDLEESSEKYKALVNSANDAIFVADADSGIILEANKKASELIGITAGQIIGMHQSELHPEESREFYREIFNNHIESGKATTEELLVQHSDGRSVPVEISANILEYGGKKVIQGIFRDVTERRAVQRALIESEEKFRAFFDMAPTAIIINPIDPGGISNLKQKLKHATMNRKMYDFLGYSEEELGEMTVVDITHPDDITPNLVQNQELIEGKRGSYRLEKRYIRNDGSVMWGYLNVDLLRDADGIPTHTMTTFSDVTESKIAEEAIRESEKQYRSLAENLPAIVYRIDLRNGNKMKFFNNMLQPITGYAIDEVGNGKICSMESLMIPDDREHVLYAVSNAIVNDSSFNAEYRIVHKSGNIRYLQEHGIPIRGTDGKPLYIEGVIFDITSRKKVEEELFQSKVDWEDTFDTISDMITIHDNDYNIIRANRAAQEMLKLPSLELERSLKCYRYYHGTDAPPERCPSCECLTTGKPATFEIFEPNYNKYFEVRAMPRLTSKNRIIGVTHVVRDITERKEAEKALKDAHDMLEVRVKERTSELRKANDQLLVEISERMQLQNDLQISEKRYKRFFEDSPTSLWEMDFSLVKKEIDLQKGSGKNDLRAHFDNNPDEVKRFISMLNITDVNVTTLEIYKARSKKEFLVNYRKTFCKETDSLFLDQFIAIADERLAFETEGITKKLDGTKNHISVKFSVPVGYEDTFARVLLSVVDITERRAAEEALIESESSFRKLSKEFNVLLDSIPDNLLLLDRDLNIMWANSSSSKTFGDKVLTGKRCHVVCNRLPHLKLKCPTRKSFQTGRSAISQITFSDGKIFDIRAYPIKDENGEVKNVIEVMRDITSRVQMEEEAKFIQAKLIHTNKMTALGTLVSGVAHEINNPNSFIMSNAELLSIIWKDVNSVVADYYKRNKKLTLGGLPYTELRDAMPKLLRGITEGSSRIKTIIDNLKDFSRPEQTSFDDDVNMNDIIMVSVSILSNHIKNSTLHFKTHCIKDIPGIRGNKQQLEQVIINLIDNALQSLSDKEKSVRVSTSYNEELDSVIVNIRDEGTGIEDEIVDRITEPFFTTKIDSGGTGLGLSISYAIINDHNGSMKFESTVGKGTTVTIRLPRGQ